MGGRKRLRWKKRLSQRCWLNTVLLYLDGSFSCAEHCSFCAEHCSFCAEHCSFWAEHRRHGNYHKRRLSHPKNEETHLQLNTGGASHISKTISESISQESQTVGGQRGQPGLGKTSCRKMQARPWSARCGFAPFGLLEMHLKKRWRR